eukprot:7780384-Karenia_brevis.AAC.1
MVAMVTTVSCTCLLRLRWVLSASTRKPAVIAWGFHSYLVLCLASLPSLLVWALLPGMTHHPSGCVAQE